MLPRPINVAVVHEDFLIRAGLVSVLADCCDMVVEGLKPTDAGLTRFDVVVADPRSGMAVLGAVAELAMRWPRVAIIASSDGAWPIRAALERGAAAYVVAGESGDEIVCAVRTAYKGAFHVSACISARLAESLADERLTAREEEVLFLVSDGLCNKHIAARLDITVGTVKTHLRTAFDKLRVRSRTEAVVTIQRRGLLRQCGVPVEAIVRAASPRSFAQAVPA